MTASSKHRGFTLYRIGAVVLFLSLIGSSSDRAHADVVDWFVFKDRIYTQTANNVRPTTVDLFVYDAFILTDPGDFGVVSMTGPGVNIPFTPFGPTEWAGFGGFGTQASLDTALPSNATYTISGSGGSLGSYSENITLGPDRYPSLAPYLSGNSFNDISNYDASKNLVVNFGQPAPGDTQITGFSAYIYDELTDTDVFSYYEGGSGPFSGSFVIAGGM